MLAGWVGAASTLLRPRISVKRGGSWQLAAGSWQPIQHQARDTPSILRIPVIVTADSGLS